MPVSCWFWNIDAKNRAFFDAELRDGRLRQGWGYDDSLDLSVIAERMRQGLSLDGKQEAAWSRCREMLQEIQPGDFVCVKGVPERSLFTLVRVEGSYRYDYPGTPPDYGHLLPVEVLRTLHYDHEEVPAGMAAALRREAHPLRRTVRHHAAVEQLAAGTGDATSPQGLAAKLAGARGEALSAVRAMVRDLTPRELEYVVGQVLRTDGYRAEWTAGPSERGADFIATHETPYGVDFRLAVQVKHHRGTTGGAGALDQLNRAFEERGVDGGLLVTSADDLDEGLSRRLDEMKRTRNVSALYGDDLVARIAEVIVAGTAETEG